MLEKIKQTFEDIRNAIVEKGVEVDPCDSPTTYANSILNISQDGGKTMVFIPVFKSSEMKPDTPTSSISASNPTDYPEGWSSPDGLTGNIWMSYTLVGTSYVYIPWTEPILICNDSSGDTFNGTRTFLIYLELSSLTLNPSRPIGGHWDVAQNKLIGPITSVLSDGSSAIWSDENNHVDGMYTYMCMGTFDSEGDLLGTWSFPICLNSAKDGKDGKDGRNGTDGVSVEFIYKLCTDKTEFDELETPYSDPDVTDFIPEGWLDQPENIDDTHYRVEAACTRKLDATTGKWTEWSVPIIWAIWGGDGTDGDGVEYIFRMASAQEVSTPDQSQDGKYHLTGPNTMPPRSQQELIEGAPSISPQVLIKAFQKNGFVPGNSAQAIGWDRNWTADPSDVSSSQPYEFCSIRREVDGEWKYFSEPVLWSKWPYADVSVFTSFVFTRSPEDLSTDVPKGGTKENPIPEYTEMQDGQLRQIEWFDSIPSGSVDTIWMTQRLFGDEENSQDWCSPCRMSDTAYMQVEYSLDYPWSSRPLLPNLNDYISPGSEKEIDIDSWRNNCYEQGLGTWDDAVDNAMYMAISYKSAGSWSDWTVTKIRNEINYNQLQSGLSNLVDEVTQDLSGALDNLDEIDGKVNAVIAENNGEYGIKGSAQIITDSQTASITQGTDGTFAGVLTKVKSDASSIAALEVGNNMTKAAIIAAVNGSNSFAGINADNIVLDGNNTTLTGKLSAMDAVINKIDVNTLNVAEKLNTGTTSGLNTVIENGTVTLCNGSMKRAEFGIDGSGNVILTFYDSDGETPLYNLGPAGWQQA